MSVNARLFSLLIAAAAAVHSGQAAVFVESAGRVVIEAEHFDARQTDPGDNKHWHVVPDDNRSDFLNDHPADTQVPDYTGARGGYIVSLPNTGQNQNNPADVGSAPSIDYKVRITTPGEYQLYLRWAGYDGSADSIYAQIREVTDGSGGAVNDWYRYALGASTAFAWHGEGAPEQVSASGGDEPAVWTLAAGTYTIRISQREDGSAVDALILQSSALAPPEDPGPPISNVEGVLIAQQPSSLTVSPGATASLTVQALASGAITYQWQKAAPGSTTFTDIAGATSATYTTPALAAADAGSKYRVNVTSGGTTLASREVTIQVDDGPPALVSALGGPDLNRVTLVFSEKVDAASATAAGNYSISGGLSVSGATLADDGRTVTLTTGGQTAGTGYTVTVNGVKDLVGNAISNGTIGFQGASRHVGGLRVDLYRDIGGTAVDLLVSDPKYPANPDVTLYWDVFGPFGSGNPYGDNYGGRASGWIVPPVTGEYKFFLRSDDASQLYLSSDETPGNAVIIAEQTGCCNAFTDSEGVLSSFPIQLTAGRRYYVEALWKEGGGGDYLQVAWRTPNDPDLNSTAGLQPIPGRFLEAVVDPTSTLTITQQPSNVTVPASSPFTMSVDYVASSAFGTNATVQWQKAAAGSTSFTDIAGATGADLTVPFASPLDNNAKFRAVVSIGTLTNKTSAEATLTVTGETTPPAVTSVSGTQNAVTLVFSEPLDPASAAAAANYTLDGGASVSSATVVSQEGAPGTVRLAISGATPGNSYTLSINNVKDLSGNAVAAGTKTSFTAFHISESFDGALAANAILAGPAKVLPSGVLELTTNAGSQQGSLIFTDVLPNASVQRFTATFDLFIGRGSGNPADGFSFNIGPDILFDPENPNTFGEEGTGSGLTVAFDTYDNGGGEAPAISLKWAGTEFATTNVSKATLVNNQWVDVVIKVDADGTIDVQHNNIKYYDNEPIPGWAPIDAAQIGLGARTGGENAAHHVDNFNVLFNAELALPQPPSVTITSPANNATFAAGAAVTITVNATDPEGQISRVEFFANGQKIGESTTAPYSFTVPSAPQGAYLVQARVTDAQGITVPSGTIKVLVGNPDKILYLHGGSAPNASDEMIITHLISLGYDVVTVSAPQSDTSNADGTVLVVASSTVNSGDVGDKFRDLAIPAITWEQALQDNFLMTTDEGSRRGTIGGQTQLDIVTPAHPMAAGLSGVVAIADAPVEVAWGIPDPTAATVGKLNDGSARFGLYGYDKGALLVGGTAAPARRVFVPMTDSTYANLNAAGKNLIHAAFDWALGRVSTDPSPEISTSLSGTQLTITWTGGGTLQAADSVTGPWADVDSDGSFTADTTAAPVRFFRVRQ